MGVTLRSLDLGCGGPSCWFRDGASCWRATCNVLNHSLRDKVMPVLLTSYDLFRTTFTHIDGSISKAEIHAAMRTLLGRVIDRLGDSNLRLHESAQACVLLCAQAPKLAGFRAVLSMLKAHLNDAGKGRERNRVFFGIIDTVNFLLRHCPQQGSYSSADVDWCKPDDIVPFVAAGLDDALGPRIRSSALTLAVTVRTAFGNKALLPLMLKKFCQHKILPGAIINNEEDALMDQILEHAGMVLGNCSAVQPRDEKHDLDVCYILNTDVDILCRNPFKTTDKFGIQRTVEVW